MKQCAHCGGKFGLARYRVGFRLQFCRKSCKYMYLAKLAQEREKTRRWLAFLARGSPT